MMIIIPCTCASSSADGSAACW